MSDLISREAAVKAIAEDMMYDAITECYEASEDIEDWKEVARQVLARIPSIDEDFGCDGCKYIEKDKYEMPCLVCRNSHMNMWTKGEDDG